MSLDVHTENPLLKSVTHERIVRIGPDELEKSRDALGNTVFTSENARETVLGDAVVPSQIVVSERGRKVVKNNPGLLHQIKDGDFEVLDSFNGMEGNVHLVELLDENGEKCRFVVKYTSAVEDKEQGLVFYTPQVDAMRVMQLAQRDKPVKGINYVEPLIATIDISVSPYIEDAIDLRTLAALAAGRADLEGVELSDQAKRNLQELLSTERAHEIMQFIQYNAYDIVSPKSWPDRVMSMWLLETFNKREVEFITKEFSRIETVSPHNTLVSTKDLLELARKTAQSNTAIRATNYDYQTNLDTETEFLHDFRGCCHVIEVLVGNEKLYEREKRRSPNGQ